VRFSSRSSAQSCLCWVERCFCVKNRHARCVVCYDFAYNDSIVVKPKVMFWMWRSKDIAIATCRPTSADNGSLLFWANFFAAAKGRASNTTSPARWEAHLLWEAHLCSRPCESRMRMLHAQPIAGKLGRCNSKGLQLLAQCKTAHKKEPKWSQLREPMEPME